MQTSYQEPEELLAEESFYHWYLKSDEAAIAQWNSWIAQHPGHQALADEAVHLLGQLHLQEGPVGEARVEIAYNKLQENIQIMTAGRPAARVVPLRARRWWMAAAAVVILAVAGVGILKYTGFFTPTAETQYGQIKEQRLPDGSEVTLNAHSKISYFSGWKEGIDREVWVNGEAFFHVRKTPQKSRFIVHASGFDIIVTGTRFNVVNRDGVTNVMLQEG
ncbi:MAG TPA: FecR family protein, partial [Chitinophagaceae bacterium]|nr:FecR family protein [Chitinophagaceae bacterium]